MEKVMTQRQYMDLKRCAKYSKESKVLAQARENYDKYLYLKSLPNLEVEIQRLGNLLNRKNKGYVKN